MVVLLCFVLKAGLAYHQRLFLVLVSCQTVKVAREREVINVMEGEGEIMKVENLSPSGGLCSLPGMCCQSESLLSPYLPT